jgi:nitroreductase
MDMHEEAAKARQPTYEIQSFIRDRWSPRSMTGEEMSDEQILSLFEAARWAPSSYNNQPWRFIYAKRNTPEWNNLFNLMVDFNKSWTQHAAAIGVIISKKTFDHNGKPSRTHSFDTGAAWMSLALEGSHRGYVVHGMEGFDYDKAKTALEIPDDHQVEAMFAVGLKAPKEALSAELQKKEAPGLRRPLTEIVMKGKFRK